MNWMQSRLHDRSQDQKKGLPRMYASLLFGILALVFASGCTNNLSAVVSRFSGDNQITTVNPNGQDGDSSAGLTLTRVQKNTLDPNGVFDLIGDGSGSMATACTRQASGSNYTSTCSCAYTYTSSSGNQIGPVEVNTTYLEQNMIRCRYDNLPTDLSTLKIRIHLTNSDTYSNEVTFRFTGTGTTLSSSSADSFVKVERFQCKDIVYIPYLWDHGVYDPFLSENPKYSYPLNFYTTNMGRTMATYSGGDPSSGVSPTIGWNCPQIPNDKNAGMDLRLYSAAADDLGSKAIYPNPTGSFDRSTFHVAKRRTGVFSVAVNAYMLPNVFTVTPPATTTPTPAGGAPMNTGLPPLGYAARPVPLSNGGDSCPDPSTPIPVGYKWAKLWLFRMQLPKRTYPTSNKLFGLGKISCAPPIWNSAVGAGAEAVAARAAGADNYFPGCNNIGSSSELRFTSPATANQTAPRVFEGTGMCSRIHPGSSTLRGFASGTDYYEPWKPAAPGTSRYSCAATPTELNDPAGLCSADFAIASTEPANYSNLNEARDVSTPLPQAELDLAADDHRADYLFVVTPPSVNRDDMDPSRSSTYQKYTPMRFIAPDDCLSNNIDSPLTAGDCSETRMLRNYELKKHEVGSPGNPGATDSNRAGDFPLCVLQPD